MKGHWDIDFAKWMLNLRHEVASLETLWDLGQFYPQALRQLSSILRITFH